MIPGNAFDPIFGTLSSCKPTYFRDADLMQVASQACILLIHFA